MHWQDDKAAIVSESAIYITVDVDPSESNRRSSIVLESLLRSVYYKD